MMNPAMMGQINPELMRAMMAQPSAPQSLNPQMDRPQGPMASPGPMPGAPVPPGGGPAASGAQQGGPSMQQLMQVLGGGGGQRAPYMMGGGM